MTENSEFRGVLSSSEAVERRAGVAREYLNQLVTTLNSTDTTRYPRYSRRLELEIELIKEDIS